MADIMAITLTVYKPAVKTSKLMFYQPHRMTGPTQRNPKPVSHPQMTSKAINSCPHIPSGMGTPLKEGELCCYKCGQKGHIKPQCPKLKGKQWVASVQSKTSLKKMRKCQNH